MGINDIDNTNYPTPKQDYRVLVRCFTFNQSKYIEDALNGFAMQQTNFSFVCLVMDDASTDGEQEVIKTWMERECDMSKAETIDIPTSIVIIVPHKNNSFCTFAFYLLKQNLYRANKEKMQLIIPWREKCEYEAPCEGDDYWIDPLKLQKQVDALEKDENVMMVYGDYRTIDEFGKEIYRDDYDFLKQFSKSGDILPELFMTNFPLTCTVCIKREVLASQFYIECPTKIDFTLFMAASFWGNVLYIEEKIAAYRKQADSLTNSKLNLVNKAIDVSRTYACLKYISGWAKKRSAWINIRIKYHIMIYAIQQYRNKNEKALILELLQKRKNYLYLMIALTELLYRKVRSTIGLGSKYKTY